MSCLTVVVFVTCLCLKTFGVNTHESNSLLKENVEALSSGEASSSDIICDASSKRKCAFYCGLCKKKINASGATQGTHSCSK